MNKHEQGIFDIDTNRLPEEWREQAKEYRGAAIKVADAMKEHEQARLEKDIREAELEEVTASTSLKIRKNPEGYGLAKITEDAVKMLVLLQPELLNVG